MAKKELKSKRGKGGGLSAKTYSGLSKKRMEKSGSGTNLRIKKGESATVQFLEVPKNMLEFDQHQFQDKGKYNYVPCAGDDCPLCEDDDEQVSNVKYRFICNVWDFGSGKVKTLEGPKTLAGRIRARYDRKKDRFLKRTFDVSLYDTEPSEWDVEGSDEDPLPTSKTKELKRHDLQKTINDSLQRYFGNALPSKGSKSALDDDDEDFEEDEYDEDDLDEMEPSEVKKIAKSLGIKTVNKEGDKRSKAQLIKLILKKQG